MKHRPFLFFNSSLHIPRRDEPVEEFSAHEDGSKMPRANLPMLLFDNAGTGINHWLVSMDGDVYIAELNDFSLETDAGPQ